MTIRYAPNTYEGTLELGMHTADNQITVYMKLQVRQTLYSWPTNKPV